MRADFTCSGLQSGWSWRSSAAAPEMWGVAMLVPSNTANGAPANSGVVEERIWPPGAEMSGFRSCPNGVGPAEERVDGLAVAAGDRADVDEGLIDGRPRGRHAVAAGLERDRRGRYLRGRDVERPGEDVCVRDGGDADRVGGRSRGACGAEPEV